MKINPEQISPIQPALKSSEASYQFPTPLAAPIFLMVLFVLISICWAFVSDRLKNYRKYSENWVLPLWKKRGGNQLELNQEDVRQYTESTAKSIINTNSYRRAAKYLHEISILESGLNNATEQEAVAINQLLQDLRHILQYELQEDKQDRPPSLTPEQRRGFSQPPKK